MRKLYLIFYVLIFSQNLVAQSNHLLKGIVTYQNSATPISNVFVRAEGADQKKTDSKGLYLLKFVKKQQGEPAHIRINKSDHLVINDNVVRNFTIPHDTTDVMRYRIIICKKEEYQERKLEYADKLLAVKSKNLNRKLLELQKNIAQEENQNQNLQHEIQALENERIHLKKQVNEMADRLARIDLTTAFDFEKKVLDYYKKGMIESAISELEEHVYKLKDDILEQHRLGTEITRRSEQNAIHAVETFKLLVDGYAIQFDYKAMKKPLESMSFFLNHENFSHLFSNVERVTPLTLEIAANYYLGNYQKAVKGYQSILQTLEGTHSYLADSVILQSYLNLSSAYLSVEKFDSALVCLNQLESLFQKSSATTPVFKIMFYNRKGSLFYHLNELDSAILYQQKSIPLLISDDLEMNFYPLLMFESYNNLSQYLGKNGDQETGFNILKLLNLKLNQLGKEFTENNPIMITVDNNMASFFVKNNQPDSAMVYYRKAYDNIIYNFGMAHPLFPKIAGNIAFNYVEINMDSSIYYRLLVIQSLESLYGKNHLDLGFSYLGLIKSYKETRQYKLAFEYSKKLIELTLHHDPTYPPTMKHLQKSIRGDDNSALPDHPDLMSAYNIIASLYNTTEQYDSSLIYFKKIVNYTEQYLPNHEYLPNLQKTLVFLYLDANEWDDQLLKYLKDLEKMNWPSEDILDVVGMRTALLSYFMNLNEKNKTFYNVINIIYSFEQLRNKSPKEIRGEFEDMYSIIKFEYYFTLRTIANKKDKYYFKDVFQAEELVEMEEVILEYAPERFKEDVKKLLIKHYLYLGMHYQGETDAEASPLFFSKALDIDSTHLTSRFMRGVSYYILEKNKLAIVDLDKAFRDKTEQRELYYSLRGRLALIESDLKMAKFCFEKFASFFPEDAVQHYYWALYFIKKNKKKKALKELNKLVEKGDTMMVTYLANENFKPLHSNKRFQLLKKKAEIKFDLLKLRG